MRVKTPVPDRAKRLRALLNDRAKAASDRALSDGGSIPAEELDELERLSRLVTLAESAEPAAKKRWVIAAVLFATLLIVSLLLFARVPTTEIELDLTTSEVSFVVATQQVLTESMNVSSVGISGVEGIELPADLEPPSSTSGDLAIRVSPSTSGTRAGIVSLSALTVPATTRVDIRLLDTPRTYRLSLRGPNLDVRIGVLGPTEISVAGMPVRNVAFNTPASIVLNSNAEEMFVDLTPAEPAPALSPLLPITQLELLRVDESPDADRSVVRRISAIRSGTVFLESLNGQERLLRPGQSLEFEEIEGQIRMLRLADDHIALQLHARVRGMRTGSGATDRSLMPTWLEWLYARHGVSLLWGTTLYVFGLIAGILRWWRGGLRHE